jgi:hypothetical protein
MSDNKRLYTVERMFDDNSSKLSRIVVTTVEAAQIGTADTEQFEGSPAGIVVYAENGDLVYLHIDFAQE